MTTNKPVVIYGASGYTGRLVAEFLREYNLPFIAAGRNKDRINDAMQGVPGIETASYDVVQVEHSVEALTDLFADARVVCNTVGPFSKYGPDVVEACINSGTHYTDTTGEQDWVITCDEVYGERMAERGLLLSPGIAQMYTTGEIAANICLETPALDTLDMAVFWKGFPTVASTQTILVNAAMSKAYYLEQNEYVEWPADGTIYELAVPGQHETGLALPWGGTSHPVWFKQDPRVTNVKVLGGLFDRQLMQGVPQIVAEALEQIGSLPDEEKFKALTDTALAVRSEMPPRENQRVNISVDSVHASGPLGRAHCVLRGACNYKQTGLMQAFAAHHLVHGTPRRTGFASACQAFDHRELLGVLQSFGLMAPPEVTRIVP
ncbi:MAG: saccharopine dehydrogenase [Actinophytocola sp.]|nr:saccharopine dehydrogenase [Actinophytocola sp.]